MKHTTYNKTVGSVITESLNGKINPNPIGQRPPTTEGWGKSKGIIESLLKGYSIGSITLRDIRNDKEAQKVYKGTDYLVIDGGHRIRALRDFNLNKFDVNGLRYIDLSDDVQEAFFNIEINITSYVATNKQATEIFRRLNTVTPVNHIEMIMANDTSEFTKEVRSRTAYVPEYDNDVHPLFAAVSSKGNPPKPLNWATDVNPRRKWDHFVASSVLKVMGGGNVTAGLETVEKFVEDNVEISKSQLKTLDKFLDDTLKVRTEIKRKFNTDTFSAFQAVWFGLLGKNKEFKISNHNKFAKEFFKAHSTLTGNNTNKFDTEVRVFTTNKNKTENKIVKEFARRAIKNLANEYQQMEVAGLYLDLMKLGNSVVFRDEVRSVSRDKKFDMLASQDFKCAIDGLPLDIDDAIFGHDTPWSKGGLSDDAVIIRNTHNVDMGTMTISEYKAYLEFKRAHNEMTASA